MLDGRLGAGPISWGVCEVPGWGTMLPASRVLAEMVSLGIAATELGPPGFLPREPDALRATLDAAGLSLIGGFVPLVLHDAAASSKTLATATRTADLFAAAGATTFITAVVVDEAWHPPYPLSRQQWDHLLAMFTALDDLCAARGLTHVVHPHAGTLVETRSDVDTVLERSTTKICLDTGHLVLGGADSLAIATTAPERIGHVHLKDVRGDVAASLAAGGTTFHGAILDGLFCPLGLGTAPIAPTVEALERAGYDGWYVLEQDTDLGPVAPPDGGGPKEDVRTSVEFLRSLVVGTAPAP